MTGFKKMKDIKGLYKELCIQGSVLSKTVLERHANVALFFVGIALLYTGGINYAEADAGSYGQACNRILSLVEGTFGALVTAAAGIGAIVASAVGGFKMAWTLIVVAVGAFILRAYITLFNGDCAG